MGRIVWGTVLAAVGLTGCADDTGEAQARDTVSSVRVAPVEAAEYALPIEGIGTLGAKEEVSLSFKVGGVVRDVGADVGARVEPGQILASLDMSEVDAAVARARAAAEQADRDLTRAERLYADSVVALAELENATTAAEIARAQLEAVAFDRRLAEISAPSEGVILRRSIEPGELVSPGAPAFVLASRERGTVLRVGLADRDVVRIRRGAPARVRFDALPTAEFEGSVTEIAAGAEAGTGAFMIEVSLEEADGLLSGLVGRVTITPREVRQSTLIPLAALLEADDGGGTVFVLGEEGRVERRAVSLGALVDDRVEVASGVVPGERVVTDGAAYLRDGETVEIAP